MANTKFSLDGGILGGIAKDPAITTFITGLIGKLIQDFISKLLAKKPPVPVEGGGNNERDPDDDVILPPPTKPKATFDPTGYTAKARIQKAQYNRKLFPEMYTEAKNPEGWKFGLYKQSDLREIEAGRQSMSRESKFWHDLTLRDSSGGEVGHEDLLRLGIAFRNEHHAFSDGGETRVIGIGADPDGKALPGYVMEDEGFIGTGQQAWNDSVGMNLQMKAFGEGQVKLSGSVAGIVANDITFTIS